MVIVSNRLDLGIKQLLKTQSLKSKKTTILSDNGKKHMCTGLSPVFVCKHMMPLSHTILWLSWFPCWFCITVSMAMNAMCLCFRLSFNHAFAPPCLLSADYTVLFCILYCIDTLEQNVLVKVVFPRLWVLSYFLVLTLIPIPWFCFTDCPGWLNNCTY